MNIINDKINSLKTIRNIIIDLSCCGIDYKNDISKIDEHLEYLLTNKIKISLLGEFSAGKSLLLNALLKEHIFPTGDLPFTGLPISVERSDKLCLKINILNNYLKKFENIFLDIINNYRNSKINLEDFCISSNGSNTSIISYNPISIDELNYCLLELATTSDVNNCTQIRKKRIKNASILKKLLFYFKNKFGYAPYYIQFENIKDIAINLPFDSALNNLSFVDLPGIDDIDSKYDIKETEQFKNSNLVFLVLNAERTASMINENLQDWLNEHKNHIIIINKIDLVDSDTIRKIQLKLSNKYDRPIFFVSSLLANTAFSLKNGNSSVDEIINTTKINLTSLMRTKEWDANNIENNKELIIKYCIKRNGFESLNYFLKNKISKFIEDYYVKQISKIISRSLQNIDFFLEENKTNTENSIKPEMEKIKKDLDRLHLIKNNLSNNRDYLNNVELLKNHFITGLNKLVVDYFDDLEVKPLKVLNEYTTNYNIKKYVLNIHKEVNNSTEKNSNLFYELNHEYLHFPTLDIEKFFDECIATISGSYNDLCKIITDKSQKPWFSSLRKQAYTKYKKDKQTNIISRINIVIEPIFFELKRRLGKYFIVFFEKGVEQITSSIFSKEKEYSIINQCLNDYQKNQEICSKSKKLLEEQRLLFVEKC